MRWNTLRTGKLSDGGCCELAPPAGYARSVRPVCSTSEADGEDETAQMSRGMTFVRVLTAL